MFERTRLLDIDFHVVEDLLDFRFLKRPESLLINNGRDFLGSRVLETCFAEYRYFSKELTEETKVPLSLRTKQSRRFIGRAATKSGFLRTGSVDFKTRFVCCLIAEMYLDRQFEDERNSAWRIFGLEEPNELTWGLKSSGREDLEALQETIGYRFKRVEFLDASRLRSTGGKVEQVFRSFALIGDKVIYSVLAEMFLPYPTRADSQPITTNSFFCKLVREHELQTFLICGNSSGLSDESKLYADMFEAIVGAALIDGGFQAASFIVRKLFGEHL